MPVWSPRTPVSETVANGKVTDPERYKYTENSSKNRKGGLSLMKLEHKSVTSIANSDVGVRCHVDLLDFYISKLPSEAVEKDLFYCRPFPTAPADSSKPWYSAVPIGRNNLAKMVPIIVKKQA